MTKPFSTVISMYAKFCRCSRYGSEYFYSKILHNTYVYTYIYTHTSLSLSLPLFLSLSLSIAISRSLAKGRNYLHMAAT